MDDLLEALLKKGRDFINAMKKILIKKIENYSFDEFMQYMKATTNLEEMKIEELSLEKCIELAKSELKPGIHEGACILRSQSDDPNYAYRIVICFVDKNNEPILNGKSKWWIVLAKNLSQDLTAQFGDKDMLVLK